MNEKEFNVCIFFARFIAIIVQECDDSACQQLPKSFGQIDVNRYVCSRTNDDTFLAVFIDYEFSSKIDKVLVYWFM